MADNQFRSISDSWWKRIKDVVQYVEMNVIGSSSVRKRRTAIGGEIDTTTISGGPGGTGLTGCCCPELKCIAVDGIADADLKPAYYRFTASGFYCGCGGTESNEQKLYPAADGTSGKWETKHGVGDNPLSCSYPDCTATAYWTWNGSDWDLVSVASSWCGTPLKPDYSGTALNQPATTTLSPSPQVSYWQYIEGGSLKFIVGTETVLEYKLDTAGRTEFCKNCTNTFRIKTCARVKCRSVPPAVICLEASLQVQHVTCADGGIDMDLPPVLLAGISLVSCPCASPPASPIHLYGVDPATLGIGEVAAWESGWFIWAQTSDECKPQFIPPYDQPVEQIPVRLRYVVGPGGGLCWGSQVQLQVDTSNMSPCTNITTLIFGSKSINGVSALKPISATAKATGASVGCAGGFVVFSTCGWDRATNPNTLNNLPDHYAEITISEPAP